MCDQVLFHLSKYSLAIAKISHECYLGALPRLPSQPRGTSECENLAEAATNSAQEKVPVSLAALDRKAKWIRSVQERRCMN